MPVLNLLNENLQVDVVVLEISSFQAESMHAFRPDVAVVTNLEPDHLDRYPNGVESYFAAKKRLLQKADDKTILVTNLDSGPAAQWAEGFPGRVVSFTKRDPMTINPTGTEKFQGCYLKRPKMVLKFDKTEDTFDLMTCKLQGDHNRENIMAAACAARAVGCSKVGIQKTIESFKGVIHRLEFIRRKDGVSFYNDSKATNVATCCAT